MPRSYASSCWNCGEEEVVGGSEAHPVFACSCMAEQVRAWDYRPDRWKPKGVFPKEPLLGVELEVGATLRYEVIMPVAETDPRCDHLYMKEDGSIQGVEIVTHPMTLAWARNYKFDSLLKRLREESCFVNEDYGLHVHVSRNAFQHKGKQSMSHQMRWLMFLYRNARYLHILARRKNERYASFRALQPGELKRKAQGIVFHDDSRYVAVNCNNERTFELRFFQATLDEDEFWAALEFADASVRYTRNLSSQDIVRGRGATWLDFRDWVLDHDYPALALDPSITAARTTKRMTRISNARSARNSSGRDICATNYTWDGLNALTNSELENVACGMHHLGTAERHSFTIGGGTWTVPLHEQQMAVDILVARRVARAQVAQAQDEHAAAAALLGSWSLLTPMINQNS